LSNPPLTSAPPGSKAPARFTPQQAASASGLRCVKTIDPSSHTEVPPSSLLRPFWEDQSCQTNPPMLNSQVHPTASSKCLWRPIVKQIPLFSHAEVLTSSLLRPILGKQTAPHSASMSLSKISSLRPLWSTQRKKNRAARRPSRPKFRKIPQNPQIWKICQEAIPKSKVMTPHNMPLTSLYLQRYLADLLSQPAILIL
jgi:hypothetical protein